MCLQGLGAEYVACYMFGDGVPIEEWANEFMYVAQLNRYGDGVIGKPSVNSAKPAHIFRLFKEKKAAWAAKTRLWVYSDLNHRFLGEHRIPGLVAQRATLQRITQSSLDKV